MTEILIFIMFWLIVSVLCFAIGFFIGANGIVMPPVKPNRVLSEEQRRITERARLEEENFWNYSGVPQDLDNR